MPGLLIAATLIGSLLLVQFSMRSRPMPKDRPLNVDEGLPLPEAGQASTVFSLTALFGAYFGIYLVLGIPALAGLASGTVLGLVLIRQWIKRQSGSTFEEFLVTILQGTPGNVGAFALALAAVQCAFAASELLILREIARVSLGLRLDHATILVVALAVVGYFYVLFGGYMAVFRTDVLQFALVAAMAVVLGIVSLSPGIPAGWTTRLAPRHGYWQLPWLAAGPGLYVYHFLIGSVMGLGFLSVSPDTWKRVFIVTKLRPRSRLRFLIFLGAGVAPFLVLVLLGIPTPAIPNGFVNAGHMFAAMLKSDLVFVAAASGLVASFLSAFNGALLSAVQVGLVLQRASAPNGIETTRFHWLMAGAFLTICFLFAAMTYSGNPYLLANLLLGAYAVIAGVEIGTLGLLARLPENSVLWIVVIGLVGWFLYVVSTVGLPKYPTTYQINTVPGGVVLCLTAAFVCRLLVLGDRRHA